MADPLSLNGSPLLTEAAGLGLPGLTRLWARTLGGSNYVRRVQGRQGVSFSDLTTLGVGGPAGELVEPTSSEEIVSTIREADASGTQVLVMGGGSNLLVGDTGFNGLVVRIASRGIAIEGDSAVVQAGENWDALVARTIGKGLSGLETMSGIPGLMGGAVVQNIGAYGSEISSVISSVTAYERASCEVVELTTDKCAFAYRTSRFKHHQSHIVLSARLTLVADDVSRPVVYPELACALGVEVGGVAPINDVRAAVLQLRRSKGMVIDANDPESRSAGSFFTNPIVSLDQFARLSERSRSEPSSWPVDSGSVKVSAAWLIQNAGFEKGFATGSVRLSNKHTLALVNAGDARAEDVVRLARQVRDGVLERFGVTLEPEPVLVNVNI